MLKIWQELYKLSPVMFSDEQTGAFCQRDKCMEGKMSCGYSMLKGLSPIDYLLFDYPALYDGGKSENKTD